MSFTIVAEVMDYAPASLSAGERLVLIVIAEAAQDTDRRCWVGAELLSRRAGLHPDVARRTVAKLEKAGHLKRIPFGTSKSGKRVLSVPHRSPMYELPVFNKDQKSQDAKSQDAISQDVSSAEVRLPVRKSGTQSHTHPFRTRKNQRRPWCGRENVCDERTRMIEVGEDRRPAKCTICA